MRGRALRPFIVLLIAIVVTSIVFVPPTSGTLRVAARPAPIRVTASTPEAIGPFEPNIKITDGSSPFGWQVEPTMVVNESGTVFVGWKETNGPDAAGYRVGSSYSTDQGRTWANNILMNQTHPNQNCRDSDPWMALDPRDRVHFAYLEYDPSGGSLPPCGSGLDVSNTSDGQDWGTVHYIPGLGGLVDKDSIAFDSAGRLYAAWDEGNILALSWSDDDGNHWAPIRNPGNVGHSVLGAVVATFENSTVYLTWWDIDTNNIMFEASSNRGQTWSPQVQVNDRIGSAAPVGAWQIPIPAMNVDRNSGAIYLAWPDHRNGNQDIYFANSTDGGKTFGTNHRVNDDSGVTSQWMVDLAVDSRGTVHAAWEDGRAGNWNIFYSNSTNGGATWAANLRVSSEDTPGSYNRPGDYFAIEVGFDDSVNIVWTDGRGDDFDIFFARNPGFPTATITVTTSPVGLPVTVDGITMPSPVQETWLTGSAHDIGTTSPIPINATARHIWTGWSDGGAISHLIVADVGQTITASFKKQYQGSVMPDPAGLRVLVDGVVYTTPASFWWDDGSSHQVQAPSPQNVSADVRYMWSSWSDGGGATHLVTANTALTLVATFVEEDAMRISTSPVGLAFMADGTTYSSATTFWLTPGSYHTVAVSTLQSGTPGVRYRFTSWSDGGAASHVVAFTASTSIEANFSAEYYLAVNSSVSGASGSGWYAAGATATASVADETFAVAPGERLAFRGWSGDAAGDGLTSAPIVMDGPKTAIAMYGTQYYLEVSSAHGISSGSGWYDAGSPATAILSTTMESSGPGARFLFVGWSDDASGTAPTSNPIVMDAAKVATAIWTTQYELQVVTAYGEVSGQGWYDAGSTAVARLALGVVPLTGGTRAAFVSWTGDATGTDPFTSSPIPMNGPRSVGASWRIEHELTIDMQGHGTAIGAGWYVSGSFAVATLNASIVGVSPGTRVAFAGWTGDATGAAASGSDPILMAGPRTATAEWRTEYFLRVDSDIGVIQGTGWYLSQATVTIRAPAQMTSEGGTYQFAGWTGDRTSSDSSITITMNGPTTVRATWLSTASLGGLSAPGWGLLGLVVAAALAVVIFLRQRRVRRP